MPHPYYIEIAKLRHLPSQRVRYARMLSVLKRICLAESADFHSDFSTLFSRLYAVCLHLGIDYRVADRLRRHLRQVLHEGVQPDDAEEEAAVADLCHFVRQVYGQPVPAGLPCEVRPVQPLRAKPVYEAVRALVLAVLSPQQMQAVCEGEERVVEVGTNYLYAGAPVMLLDVGVQPDGTWRAAMVVLEPDFLIDVTSLTACMKPYGHTPLNYLLRMLSPMVCTAPILLGQAANQFMDDCIHTPPAELDWQVSMRRHFADYALEYTCLPAEQVGKDYFEQARRHFEHIAQSVQERFPSPEVGIRLDEVILEPAFICPTLGLRGRLDVATQDFRHVLELKSGKADEFHYGHPAPQHEHLMQMSLYGEMLCRNFHLEWHDIRQMLFYSRYPEFFNERPSAQAIADAMEVRNGVMCLLHRLTTDEAANLLRQLTPEALNVNGMGGRFYHDYLLPQIERVTQPLQQGMADPLTAAYFTTFLSFVLRELFCSKTTDNRPDSLRGFASTWTADTHTKLLAGNMLTSLSLVKAEGDRGVERVTFSIPNYDDLFIPNFNKGEMVQCYENADGTGNVTNRQLLRGYVEELTPDSITLTLAMPQRNLHLFEAALYTIEHDASDGPAMQAVRNLFSLLTASPRRRNLLLARAEATVTDKGALRGEYPAYTADTVQRMRQADDFFLLVGPPGTGKTNVALRAMVQETWLEMQSESGDTYPRAIMVSAYTNRAIDEVCGMLEGLCAECPGLDYLRIGSPTHCDAAYVPRLLHTRAAAWHNRREALEALLRVPVVVGTVTTLTNSQMLFAIKRFRVAFIDEASQILEPQALGLLCAQRDGQDCIEKFVFIGDHKQLPAVVQTPRKQTAVTSNLLQGIGLTNLANSHFERLHRLFTTQGKHELVGMLHRQGRMHPDICSFVNRHFYGAALEAVPLEHQQEALNWSHAATPFERLVASTRMALVDVKQTPGAENLRANVPEAEAVALLVQAIVQMHKKAERRLNAPHDIGIIVPFRNQIACVRQALCRHGVAQASDFTIDTVECYQGSQRDYILFSTTVSEDWQLDMLSSIDEVEGTDVDRKLNVAITRARRQFFLIGDAALLSRNAVYGALIRSLTPLEAAAVSPHA